MKTVLRYTALSGSLSHRGYQWLWPTDIDIGIGKLGTNWRNARASIGGPCAGPLSNALGLCPAIKGQVIQFVAQN